MSQQPPVDWQDLSMVIAATDYERVHYALVIAAAAAALDKRVTLLFTLGAISALKQAGRGGGPGWHDLPSSSAATASAADMAHAELGVATIEELLGACAALGARFMVCEMAMRLQELSVDDLRHDLVVEAAGVATFLANISGGGKLLSI